MAELLRARQTRFSKNVSDILLESHNLMATHGWRAEVEKNCKFCKILTQNRVRNNCSKRKLKLNRQFSLVHVQTGLSSTDVN